MNLRALVLALSSAAFLEHLAQASPASVPGCVVKCWDNSMPMSNCGGDLECLCGDAGFQDAALRCLHSQCQTSHFGRALHHHLAQCAKYGENQANSYAELGRRDYVQQYRPYAAYGPDSPHNPEAATQSVHRRHLVATTTVHERPTPMPIRGSGYYVYARPTPAY